jgi:peptidoglycan glycosyltransferase
MHRRRTELALLVFAALIISGAYALGALGKTASLPANIGPFLVQVLVLFLIAHLATRRLAPGADGTLLPLAVLLNGIGYVFIVRLDEDLAALQANWTAVGIGAYVLTLVFVKRVRDLQRLQWTFGLIGIVLLLMPLLPGIGRNINGARIWVSLGPLNFQPGEFAKIALALFFAAYLVDRRELLAMATWRVGPLHLPEPRYLGPVVVAWAVSLVVMVAERDLGSSLLFFALFVVMLWVATERALYLGLGAVMFVVGAYVSWSQFGHVRDRFAIWRNPWADPSGDGFQIVQAIFAFAWGGVIGAGIGIGDPARIPAVETDFIFAAIGEELGLLGGAAILAAYVLIVGVGLRIARVSERPFEKLLATGLTTIVGVQAFIIIGGVTRLVPLTGVTLPFVSYGGSSLVANYVLIALLMRISDEHARRTGEIRPRQTRRDKKRAAKQAEAVV